ncbi:hypothetical protein HCN44_005643 [Aphidius gifuensis]|uniref:Uncharacterized protein n=1 Tax=Aphidius gifuensis TaxID=684658 RepID=A0A834Y6G8_APHGI|nr:hypothetical protein HCN44_005643 [Aphidius gifuensis]
MQFFWALFTLFIVIIFAVQGNGYHYKQRGSWGHGGGGRYGGGHGGYGQGHGYGHHGGHGHGGRGYGYYG